MRLTRVENIRFYRNTTKGELRINNSEMSTTDIIDKLPHETSLLCRILRNPSAYMKGNRDGFATFLEKLIFERTVDTDKLPKVEQGKLPGYIEKHLSAYGRNLKYDKKTDTFEQLLENQYNGKNVNREFSLMQEYIADLINHKKAKLEKSITKNRIPFKIEGNEVIPTSEKMKWLFSFLKSDGIDGKGLAHAYNKCEYSKLHKNIKDEIHDFYKN